MKKPDDLKQIKELLEIVKHKVDRMEFGRTGELASMHLMKDQQSVINEKLDAISKDLNNPKIGLKRINERMEALWDQVMEITGNIVEIKETVKKIDSKIDQNNGNIRKLDKRVKTTEAELGIFSPPELTLT